MRKQCFKCLIVKDIEQFYKHKQMGDGHLNKCKSCTKKDVKDRYNDPEAKIRIIEYEKKRFKTEHRKNKLLEYQRKSRANHPNKHKARRLVKQAIASGILKKLPCEICKDNKSEAHHPDYRSPLKVMWLCFKHHRKTHNQKIT